MTMEDVALFGRVLECRRQRDSPFGECVTRVSEQRDEVDLRVLDDPAYRGGSTSEEGYLIISRK